MSIKEKRLQGALYGAVARQRRLAMKDFSTSLACFLIVLGQLCFNFNLIWIKDPSAQGIGVFC